MVLRVIRLLVVVLAIHVAAVDVFAGTFRVYPIRVELSEKSPSKLLRVTNAGDEDVRLQLKVFEWRQTDSEDVRLVPTNDVLFFPQLLTLKAGKSRSVRLSSTLAKPDSERTYRLIVQELPNESSAKTGAIYFRTRMSIPVFFEPHGGRADPVIGYRQSGKDNAVIDIRNQGNLTMFVDQIKLTGTLQGRTLFEGAQKGWYLLPGSKRAYGFELPAGACRADRLQIEIKSKQATVRKEVNPTVACATNNVSM